MFGKKMCFTIETYRNNGSSFLTWVGSNEALMASAVRTLVLEGEYSRFRITAHDGFDQDHFCEVRLVFGNEMPSYKQINSQLTKKKIEAAFYGSEIICVV